jgi:hypothetical protein
MLDGDEDLPLLVWRLPRPLPLYLDQRLFQRMKIQAFVGCASCCILLCACFVSDLCSCFPQHPVTLAVTGFINLKLGVTPYV